MKAALTHAVIFVNLWPEPRSSAAGIRTQEMSEFLRGLGYHVIGIGPGELSIHSKAWEESGVRTLTCDPNSSQAAEILSSFSPELVFYDRFFTEEKYGWRARELWPNAIHIIDTSDLHFLRGARQRAHLAGASVIEPDEIFFEEDLLREMASLHRADACFVVSPHEAKWLTENGIEKERVCYLPFSANVEINLKPQKDRSGFCFLGNYLHAPNVDAVKWLESELWPAVRKQLPQAELHLYGAYPPQIISQLHGRNGIFSHGFIEDHRAAISKHQVLLAPLRFGAGIKGKILEAWATGTPVLGTPLAFEGMGSGFAEFNSAQQFVDQIQYLQNAEVFRKNVDLGIETLKHKFDRKIIFNTFSEFIENTRLRLPEIRRSLTGRLLRHHGAQSLKYFSQWIEEKNKNRKLTELSRQRET